MMKIIFLRGVPGSGKSTYAEKLICDSGFKKNWCRVVSADNFFISNGEYKFKPELLGDAHKACFRAFHDYVMGDDTDYLDLLIVDNTNVKLWELSPYVAVANMVGLGFEIHRMECKLKECAKRNIHGVPSGKIESMHSMMDKIPYHWGKEIVINTEGENVE